MTSVSLSLIIRNIDPQYRATMYITTPPNSVLGERTLLRSHSNFLKVLTFAVLNWFSVTSAIVSCDDAISHFAVASS